MPARLVTIPISHFCEKARWALDRAGVDYAEEPHVQLIHVASARLAGGGRTVPVLVTTDDEVLAESSDILRWSDRHVGSDRRLYPADEVSAIESWLDEGLGPDGRLWMYEQTLPVIDRMEPWALAGVPHWERRAFRVGRRPVDAIIRRHFGIDAASSAAALARCDEVFDDIAGRLSDGRRFLTGDRFTAADLTFAALSAPLLLPERYGSPLPPLDVMPEPMAREVRRLRAHPAGQFAERLYREERGLPPRE